MPKESYNQHAFTAGELSPLLYGRQDIEKYKLGLSVCVNSFPFVQGGWTRRPGTVFLKTTKHGGTKTSRLLSFQFGTSQSYILEFGDLYARFFTLQGILTETAQSIEGITQANPGVITITGHGYADGDRLHIDDNVGGMHQLRLREVIVANKTPNTFEIQDIYGTNIDTSGYDAWTSGGKVAKIIEVTTPYAHDELSQLRISQTDNILYLFHPDYAIRKLERNSATSWSLSTIEFVDGPYLPKNDTATTLTPAASTGSGITITASSTTGINGGDGFKSTDVGRYIRLDNNGAGTTWGYAKIVTFTDTTHVDVDIVNDFSGTGGTTDWRLGLWSDTTGFPATGTFHEDRMVAGGCAAAPSRLDLSKSSLHENFQPTDVDGTVSDDSAFPRTLVSDTAENIRWMKSGEKALLVGTWGGEWAVRPSSLSEAITPTNANQKKSTPYGSAEVDPVSIGGVVLFVQRSQRKVRELAYVFESDGFRAPDMSLLSEHITNPSVTEMTYQHQPQSIVWAVRSDGVLLGLTYERGQDVIAWHRHELGGVGDAAGGITQVKSVATIPAPSGDRDEVYLIAERYINGTTERYVELVSKIWESGDQQEDAVFFDCSLTEVSGSDITEILGLWHLEGESASVYTDSAAHPDVTVTNGKITLDLGSKIITVGHDYNSDGEMLPIEAGAADGSAQGKTKRIARLGFWLFDTLGLQFGPDADNLTEILVRQWGDQWGVATALFTGVARERFEGDYDRLGQVYWRANGPFPANVLAVMPQVVTQDDS